jgi:hypothetical protein
LTRIETFRNAKSFVVYYGKDCLQEMTRFNIAILEPMAQDIGAIRELQNKGTTVLAYLSVVEARPEQVGFHLHKDNLLTVKDEFLMNNDFHTYYADLRSERWMRHLYQKTEMYLTEYGCDGLFLDTIADLEDCRIPVNIKYSLIETAVAFLETTKKNFDHPLLVQNNGLGLLVQYTKDCIDGVCWENPAFRHGITGKINKVIFRRLKTMQKDISLKVFLLTEESAQSRKIGKFAERNNFLYYDAPADYIRIG